MGNRLGRGSAHAHGADITVRDETGTGWDVFLGDAPPKTATAHTSPKKKLNSQKESVPKASPKSGKLDKAKSGLSSDEEPAEQTLEERIEALAQKRYVEAAALDAAVAMVFAHRGSAMPTAKEIEAKLRIDPTPELWDEMWFRVAEGQSVFTICKLPHMPASTTVYRYIAKEGELAKAYQAALHMRTDKQAEQIVETSRELQLRAEAGASTEEVNAGKVLINSLQWTAARLNPAKYGDKQAIDLNATVKLSEQQVDDRLGGLIAKAMGAGITAAPEGEPS